MLRTRPPGAGAIDSPSRPRGSRVDEEVSLLLLFLELLNAKRINFIQTVVKKLGSAIWMLTPQSAFSTFCQLRHFTLDRARLFFFHDPFKMSWIFFMEQCVTPHQDLVHYILHHGLVGLESSRDRSVVLLNA